MRQWMMGKQILMKTSLKRQRTRTLSLPRRKDLVEDTRALQEKEKELVEIKRNFKPANFTIN